MENSQAVIQTIVQAVIEVIKGAVQAMSKAADPTK